MLGPGHSTAIESEVCDRPGQVDGVHGHAEHLGDFLRDQLRHDIPRVSLFQIGDQRQEVCAAVAIAGWRYGFEAGRRKAPSAERPPIHIQDDRRRFA